jgi:hypothetical protein
MGGPGGRRVEPAIPGERPAIADMVDWHGLASMSGLCHASSKGSMP